MEEQQLLVLGKHVLEVGSGCGLSGILAAKLGAAQVGCCNCTICLPSCSTIGLYCSYLSCKYECR